MVTAMATAKAIMWVMVMVMRLAGNKEGKTRVARVMVMAMRVVGNGEGKGGKTMAMVTRVAGERMAMVTKRAMMAMTRSEGAGGSDDPPLRATCNDP